MKMKDEAQTTPTRSDDTGFFEPYSDFAQLLRSWFIAYGIGVPALLLTSDKCSTTAPRRRESATRPHAPHRALGPFRRFMKTTQLAAITSLVIVFSLLTSPKVAAHCDTLDGPVVEDARVALKKADVTPVLKWVSKDSEKEVREAFAAALKVRLLGDDARKLADMHFFETLVRVHRAGEGAPFTGLKPAGTIDPAFVAADKALSEGSVADLSADITKSIQEGLRRRYTEVVEKKKHADESVESGRAYVAAYVQYAHYIEAVHNLTSRGSEERHHLHAEDKHRK